MAFQYFNPELPLLKSFLLFFCYLCHFFEFAEANTLTTVTTTFGDITGIYNSTYDVRWFFGIPYAEPPVGIG